MEKTQHTPGPWMTKGPMSNFDKGKESIFIVDEKGDTKTIAQTSRVFNGSITRANARLIAAAPELLAMLELAARYLKHPDVLEITKKMAMSGEALNERIATAISKAKGE